MFTRGYLHSSFVSCNDDTISLLPRYDHACMYMYICNTPAATTCGMRYGKTPTPSVARCS